MSSTTVKHTSVIGKRNHTSLITEFSNEPISQNVILASVVSASARYFINDSTEPISPPTMIPDKVSIIDELFLNTFATNKVAATVKSPNIKASPLMKNAGNPSIIARAAPTPAPLETPSRSGETSLFLNVSC